MHIDPAPEHLRGVIQGDLPGQVALREWVDARLEYWANPPWGRCSTEGCPNSKEGVVVLLGQDDHTCSDCQRKAANRHQAEMFYPCDICGADQAFRDPAHRRDEYLCAACHKRENDYEPSDRSMLSKTQARVGVKHSMGRKIVCEAAGRGTDCKGEIKWRGSAKAHLCNRHHDPKRYNETKRE